MKELLDTLTTWQADGTAGGDIGRAVVVRTFGSAPRPEGAVLLYATDGRIAGSVSGGCVEGAAAEEIERARATGHARVIRYGISDEQAWDVGPRLWRHDRRARRAGRPGRRSSRRRAVPMGAGGHGSAVVTPLPADSPPAEFGAAPAGRWRATGGRAGRHRRRPADRHARHARPGRRAGRRRPGRPEARPVADGRARRSLAVHRGLPGPAAPRRRRRRRGRPLAGPARARARVRDRRRRRPGRVRDEGALPGRRPPHRRLAGRGRRRDRARAERRGRGPVPRRQVRRAGHRRGAPSRLPLRRARSGRARPRPTGTHGCSRPASARQDLARLRGPVGLDLGGRAPAETALAILAEIVAERYGGSGAPMRERALARA